MIQRHKLFRNQKTNDWFITPNTYGYDLEFRCSNNKNQHFTRMMKDVKPNKLQTIINLSGLKLSETKPPLHNRATITRLFDIISICREIHKLDQSPYETKNPQLKWITQTQFRLLRDQSRQTQNRTNLETNHHKAKFGFLLPPMSRAKWEFLVESMAVFFLFFQILF